MKTEFSQLVEAACAQRQRSYSPYSKFKVGAALLTKSGRVFLGTNVENVSFGLSNCAERSAVFGAISAGETEFVAIAICADGVKPTAPCGACRQVLLEFSPEMSVVLSGETGLSGEIVEMTVADLLPLAFFDFRDQLRNPAENED